jgi:hypothetical protein
MAGVMQALALTTDLQPFIEAYRAQTGRPSTYNDFIAAEIIERLTDGETLRAVCSDAHMPTNSTVYDWMQRAPAFSSAVAAARRVQATVFVEQGLEILDTAPTDSMAHVQKADKRANFRMTLAKCFDREQYGDKVQQDVNLRGVVIHTEDPRLSGILNGD